MSISNELEPLRRTMVVFFVVDTSGCMGEWNKIDSLNISIQELIPYITDASEDNANVQTKIAVLEYSTNVEWMYPSPIEAENFQWRDLCACGLSNLGEACIELNKKLSHSHGFMNEDSEMFAPIVILFSGSEPTDDYKRGLKQLKNNAWFKAAGKVAVAIGDDVNRDVLAEFTGTKEAVLTVHNLDLLEQVIRHIPFNLCNCVDNYIDIDNIDNETQTDNSSDWAEWDVENYIISSNTGNIDNETQTDNSFDWSEW